MEYFLEGFGNEFIFIIFAYVFCVCLLIKYFKLESCIVTYERVLEIWQGARNVIFGDDISTIDSPLDNTSTDSTLDIRIFNSECCVCFNEDCSCPVTTACGHCFCGICAINLIEHCSVPMNCPLCRQECRVLFIPLRNNEQNNDNSLHNLVASSVTTYNSRAAHRFPFVNRVRNAPVMLRHLIRSFGAARGHLIFRLKCHVVAAVVMTVCYLALSTDIIPERVFGLIGFLDDILVVILLSVLIARMYTSLESSVTFDDIRAALE